MNNREIFDCIDEFVKEKFFGNFLAKVFFRYKNVFDDIAEVTIEKVGVDGINEIVYHTTFLEIGKEIDQSGLKRYLDNLENFLYKKMDVRVNCLRGDIFWAENSGARVYEQSGRRPYIVVSNNSNNKFSPMISVVPITSKEKKPLPTHRSININGQTCTVLGEQVSYIPKTDLVEFIRKANESEMAMVENVIKVQLGLNKLEDKQKNKKQKNIFARFFEKIKAVFKRKKENLCE